MADKIVLIVLDTVRRDFFNKNLKKQRKKLNKDFIKFDNCKSIYTATCTSHYTIFFGDYWNKAKNENFPKQLKRLGYTVKSYCNGAIFTGYPLKNIRENLINKVRPYREQMIEDLGVEPHFNPIKKDFGKITQDYIGCADYSDEIRSEIGEFIENNKNDKYFMFLHYWKAHYNYGIDDELGVNTKGNDCHEEGSKLIKLVRDGVISEQQVRDTYSRRVEELIKDDIGYVLDSLKESDSYDDAMILITSDHGEGLGDVGMDRNHVLYDLTGKQLRFLKENARGALRRLIEFDIGWTENYRLDYENFFHNADSDVQREIPMMVKFPNNEYSGMVNDVEINLLDVFSTVHEITGSKLDIKSTHGTSLYELAAGNERNQEITHILNDKSDEDLMRERLKQLGYL